MKGMTQNTPNVEWDFTSPSTLPRTADDDNWAVTTIPFQDGNFVVVGFTDEQINGNKGGVRHPSIFKFSPSNGGRIVWEQAPSMTPGTTIPNGVITPVADGNIGAFGDGIPLNNSIGQQESVFVAGYYAKKDAVNNYLRTPVVAKIDYFSGKVEYFQELSFPKTFNFKHVDINKVVWAYDEATKKFGVFACGRAAKFGEDWKPMVCKIDVSNGTLDKSWGNNQGFVTFSIKNFPKTGCRMYDIIQRRDNGFALSGGVITGEKNYGCSTSEIKDAYVVGLSNSGAVEWEQNFSEKDLESKGIYIDDNAKNELPMCSQVKSVEDTENEIAFSIKESSTNGEFAVSCRFDYVDVPYCVVANGGCIPFTLQTSDGYLECDLAMVKFKADASKGVTFKYALDAGRIAGLDFWNPMLKIGTSNDYLLLGADVPLVNNVPTNKVLGSVIKLTDDVQNQKFKKVWRKDFAGAAQLFCPFGLCFANDGGLVICGNNELNGDDYEIIKLGSDCQANAAFDVGNTDITANTTWNTNKTVKGVITVKTGATLTIQNCTIRFASSYLTNDYQVLANGTGKPTKVIVEKGAFLVLDGATLTGAVACKKESMWEGIEALGDPYKYAYPKYQGNVTMLNNAVISNSYYGISAGSRFYNSAGRSNPTGNDGGAIVKCTNPVGNTSNHFLNNRFSVWFAPVYSPHPSFQSKFDNTNFTCNKPLSSFDANFVSTGGLGLGSKTMLSSWSKSNIMVTKCNFKGLAGYPFENQGNAVANFDVRMVFNDCTFENFDNGINAAYSTGLLRQTEVRGSTFSEVAHGINLLDGALHDIQNNKFLKIPIGDGTSQYTSGITMFGAVNTIVKKNQFSSTMNTISSYGIVTESSGDDATLYKDNKFSDINFGLQTQNNNAGLQMRCNTHYENNLAWSINPQSQNAGWFSDQGECGNDKNQPANVFKDDHSSICHINSSIDFQYNHRDISNEIPWLSTAQTILTNCGSKTNTETCVEIEPCIVCNAKTIQQQALQSPTVWEKQVIEADLMRYLTQNPESEKELSFDDALSNLSLSNKSELAFAIALDKGDYIKAENVLASMEQKDENTFATKQIYAMMLSLQKEGKSILQIGTEQLSSIKSIANGKTNARFKAQAIVEIIDNTIYDRPIEKWEKTAIGNKIVKNKVAIIKSDYFSISPNPSDSYLNISFEPLFLQSNSVLTIFDLQGKALQSIDIQNNNINIDISHFESGIYFIKVANPSLNRIQKLIINH